MKLTRKRKLIIGTVIVLVAIVGAGVTWALSGNQGQVIEESSQTPVRRVPDHTPYNGKYITFSHLGTYTESQQPAKDGDLEVAMLTANTTYEKQLAVSVSPLKDGTLMSNSAYIFRSTQTATYTNRQVPIAGGTATIWAKNDNQEQTAFIQRGSTVAVLSFTTAGNVDNLTPEVNDALASFRWK